MIAKILDDNTVIILNISQDEEDEFLKLNPVGYIKIDTIPESRYGCYKWNPNTKTIEVDIDREIAKFKEDLINRFNQDIQDYILMNYPLEKQQSDNQQKDYYGTALLMIRKELGQSLTLDDIYLQVGQYVNEIRSGNKTLQDILNSLPDNEKLYWEQLIKAGLRKAWVVECVHVFRDFKSKVEQAKTLEELESLDYQALPYPKFPEV